MDFGLQTAVIELDDEPSWHDLPTLARQVHSEYFASGPVVDVQWGRRSSKQPRRSIRLGSYDPTSVLIRIHPSLNSSRVPAFFVQSIIFHEYLHHVLGPRHDRRFHRFERRYRYYRESRMWLRRFLPMLLGARPRPARELRVRRPVASAPEPSQITLF